MQHDPALLQSLAAKVGTPYWLYDARVLRKRIADIQFLSDTEGVQARFAMKACPATKVLQEMHAAGIWIDAVSGNEVLRALRAGHPAGRNPPAICLTADVFRDNALRVVLEHGILPNIGSPGQIADLSRAGYRGQISIRVNPGFGHGHVNACDTGGPSSKHGVWFEDLLATKQAADAAGLEVAMLHAHIGSGPQFQELHDNLTRLAAEFVAALKYFPQLSAVSLGGGIPHNYRDHGAQVPIEPLHELFTSCHRRLCTAARRELRLEIEPGRYYVAPCCTLVTRVTDVKQTRTNEKGSGATFAMVDAGFVDLVRPAMYGSYHAIQVVGRDADDPHIPREPIVVAGPLCESGDIFTRDERELLAPRMLPRPEAGDLLTLRDAGAYGYAMSSNYNSIGRAPQLWLEEDGTVEMISRRETIDDLLKAETSELLG
ncbi:MAG TPA: diaminopimelate decarboxylase [Chthoniobacteraceae bacterium]|jgi:diaminopimelate decarboxylase|nr:diaminopimelate decarboxylase [Chthoniobacteraceae bacterium]